MKTLLEPNFGLTFWTIVNFFILVVLLAKFAWKPVIKALEAPLYRIAENAGLDGAVIVKKVKEGETGYVLQSEVAVAP